ncbi:hypothetical protein N7541_005475 [Penicillium brevicompactum]|uniref:Uncharacterized protein n=1 Tax=Penicillium brevicompactum TaxID=5074 RepID=A0A9W9UTS5_PENBR|nr:hypothetical protein N7541_005475 [Penicillium brevicompactum]
MPFYITLASKPIPTNQFQVKHQHASPESKDIALFSCCPPTRRPSSLTHQQSSKYSTEDDTPSIPSTKLETIIAQIYGEYINLLGINDKIRDTLQKEKAEKEELHAYIQYHDYCLQVAEKRAWGFEKQVNKMEVELASRNATPLTDQRRQQ